MNYYCPIAQRVQRQSLIWYSLILLQFFGHSIKSFCEDMPPGRGHNLTQGTIIVSCRNSLCKHFSVYGWVINTSPMIPFRRALVVGADRPTLRRTQTQRVIYRRKSKLFFYFGTPIIYGNALNVFFFPVRRKCQECRRGYWTDTILNSTFLCA